MWTDRAWSVSLRFNGHFTGEPGLAGVLQFIEAKDDGGGGDNWTTGAISRAKLHSNHHMISDVTKFLAMAGGESTV